MVEKNRGRPKNTSKFLVSDIEIENLKYLSNASQTTIITKNSEAQLYKNLNCIYCSKRFDSFYDFIK